MTTRIDALLTSHNRRAKTLSCLRTLVGQAAGLDLHIVVADAASTDGTAAAITEVFPDAEVVPVGADIFWGGGMQVATAHARPDADCHLWLNDDVALDSDALARLLAQAAVDRVVVGALRDHNGLQTYGGLRAGRLKRLTLTPVPVSPDPVVVDTMNGNVVLVGRTVVDRIGPVRGHLFPHAFGDIDYGFRARRAGFEVVQAPGTLGTCERNPPATTYLHPTVAERWQAVTDTKVVPLTMWWNACLRHGGVLAPAYFVAPYLRALRPGTRAR